MGGSYSPGYACRCPSGCRDSGTSPRCRRSRRGFQDGVAAQGQRRCRWCAMPMPDRPAPTMITSNAVAASLTGQRPEQIDGAPTVRMLSPCFRPAPRCYASPRRAAAPADPAYLAQHRQARSALRRRMVKTTASGIKSGSDRQGRGAAPQATDHVIGPLCRPLLQRRGRAIPPCRAAKRRVPR
jgi:hypothetical protein